MLEMDPTTFLLYKHEKLAKTNRRICIIPKKYTSEIMKKIGSLSISVQQSNIPEIEKKPPDDFFCPFQHQIMNHQNM